MAAITTDALSQVLNMEQEMVLISRKQCDLMLKLLYRAEGYCRKAQSIRIADNDDATASYPGASGYAGATMRNVIQTIESHMEL